MDLYAKRTFSIDTENAFKIGPHIHHLESEGHTVIKLNLGEPDFDVPLPIKEEIKIQLDRNNTHYCDPKGVLPLREAISRQMFASRNLTVSPEQIVVFPGAKPAIGFSQQIYCNPNDEIIYPSPGFPIYESFIRYLGTTPIPIHLSEKNNFTFSAAELVELITPKTKMIFLNFPSNPTGGVVSEKELNSIADVILSKCHPNVRVYSDEIYERIIFDGKKHHSIASVPGMEKRTIISSGFSKSYAWTGGRLGYAVFPTIEEADVFKNLNINYFSCVTPYNQMAAKVALESVVVNKMVCDMVNIFEQRRNIIVELLNNVPNIHCKNPNGAFYVFPNISKVCENLGIFEAYQQLSPEIQAKTSPSTLFQMFALYNHHVAVLDRRSFGKVGSENKHYIRLSYATEITQLKEGISRLKNATQDNWGFKAFFQSGKNFY
jgi:aspartate/methionine/tyrosine aminotransferase